MKTNKSKGTHCGFNNLLRTRYFSGMLMTDREFEDEQRYQNDRRKLLNRMLHGWGVVCGLKVRATNPQSSSVIVEPGMALDCRGNEILVCSEQTIDLSTNPCSSNEVTEQDPCAEYVPVEPDNKNLYVVIKYEERGTKPEPVYAPGGSCEEKTCEFSRTQEGFCIDVINYLPRMPHPETLESGNACTDPFPCPSMNCCTDPHYIVLATISCEQRFDFLSGWIIETSGSPTEEKKFRYHVKRDMNKVCIQGDPNNNNIIDVTDIYKFERNIDNMELDQEKLVNLQFENEPAVTQISRISKTYKVEYNVLAVSGSNSGTGKIIIPLILTVNQISGWKPSENDILISEIVIGTADVCQSSIIYNAMIRNMEQRKYVPGFQWLAWILTGREEGELPLTGDMQDYCYPEGEEPPLQLAYMVDRMEIQKEIETLKELERKNVETIKEMKNEYNKNIKIMKNIQKEIKKE